MQTVPTTARPRAALTARTAGAWMLTFAGFPLGSVAARALAGPVDGPWPAILGGLVNGAVLGAAQAWALGVGAPGERRVPFLTWVLATAAGLAAGLAIGAAAVGFDTDTASLVSQGLVCGAAVGLAQAAVLVRRVGAIALAWPVWLAAAWALGWAITDAVGVSVDLQFTVFGSSGAVVVTALTLVLPAALTRTRQENQS